MYTLTLVGHPWLVGKAPVPVIKHSEVNVVRDRGGLGLAKMLGGIGGKGGAGTRRSATGKRKDWQRAGYHSQAQGQHSHHCVHSVEDWSVTCRK